MLRASYQLTVSAAGHSDVNITCDKELTIK
jgi:hypothetical protein